ncbi:MAG: type II secretion system F family protein [Candidatus Magasanikbacteria bacterium]|nr:type II secretion system F family protein [Candidatus Magasanikbacteria bacterium]
MSKEPRQLSPFELKLNNWVSDHLTRVKVMDKIFFLDHLRTMIHAGLSLVEALSVLSKEIENKRLKKVVDSVKTEVEKGKQLSEVLTLYPKIFPPMYVKMIAAGEIAGKLEEALEQIVTQMKKNYELTSSIKGAMIYPAVVISAISIVGLIMVTVVLPKITALFDTFEAALPLPTRILIAITDFMSNPVNLVLLVVLLSGGIVAYISALKKSPKFRDLIHALNLKLPIVSPVIKQINLARFSLTLSSLLKSTLPIVDAIDITADTCTNLKYKNALHNATEQIKKGIPLSEILSIHTNLFPPMVTEMIMVGEKTGEVDRLLEELSEFYTHEVDKTIKNFSTIIEPAIIVLLGLAVAGIAVAVIQPMYSLMDNF